MDAESVPSLEISSMCSKRPARSTGPGHAFLHATTQLRADRYREQANGSIQPQHAELPGRDTKATAHAEMRTYPFAYLCTIWNAHSRSFGLCRERRAAFLPVW